MMVQTVQQRLFSSVPTYGQSLPFGRALRQEEWPIYQAAIGEAKEKLGVKNLALIAPVRSLPTDVDTGFGNVGGAMPFFAFMSKLGFIQIQVDPGGITQPNDPSPYMGTLFSSSWLQINLADLERPEWGELLPKGTTQDIADRKPYLPDNRVPYQYAYRTYEKTLRRAYDTFAEKRGELPKLNDEFEDFKSDNNFWLQRDALFEVLDKKVYRGAYWKQWKGEHAEVDKALFSSKADQEKAAARRKEPETTYAKDIEAYEFNQFVAHRQKDANNQNLTQMGMGIKADLQVGWSPRDAWAYQDLMLPKWSLGCPPDYFAKDGQTWNFPILDPKQIFKADGTVNHDAPGTKFLKNLYRKIFAENTGGVRIDHTIGIVDPWVYTADAPTTKNGGRLYSSPAHLELKPYSRIETKHTNAKVKPDNEAWVQADALKDKTIEKRYACIIDEIILPLAKEAGIEKDQLIFEDLGTVTTPTQAVLGNRKLSAIRVTQFVNLNDKEDMHRGKHVKPQHWITVGTHDNPSLWNHIQNTFFKNSNSRDVARHRRRLFTEVYQPEKKTPGKIRRLANLHTPEGINRAMMTELFISPAQNIQLFFADWFGMKDNYNQPGTVTDKNWSLRIPKAFERAYFRAVRQGEAINLPKVLGDALQIKGFSKTPEEKALLDTLNSLNQVITSTSGEPLSRPAEAFYQNHPELDTAHLQLSA